MKAHVLIRDKPHYRKDAFCEGLKQLGYKVFDKHFSPDPGDVLVTWNLHGNRENTASAFSNVLVCENGYMGSDDEDRQYYAIARGGHNGSGYWPEGDESRWSRMGIDIKPWRTDGEHILVCGQRGIGSKLMRSPSRWHEAMAKVLSQVTDRPIKVRPHPGRKPNPIALAKDMEGAWAIVVWSSSVAGKALIKGIPVYYQAPHHVLDICMENTVKNIDLPKYKDRLQGFRRMAWAQWTIEEIATGEPFRRLLQL